MKFLIALAALLCLVAGDDYSKAFREALRKYADEDNVNLNEDRATMTRRYKSFCLYHDRVQAINHDPSRFFIAEDNFLSILTDEERQQHMGLNVTSLMNSQAAVELEARDDEIIPKNRDFSGVISDVKDQQTCGSCWTYGATAALEGEIFFTAGSRKVSLSEQEYLECSSGTDWNGCWGGWMKWAYTYSKESGRIAPESAYPYLNYDSGECHAEGKANALEDNNVKVDGYITLQGDSNLLRSASKHILTVALHANIDFQAYDEGLYTDNNCQESVNHAVAVVGYGDNRGKLYWKIRNSWGTEWGHKGYIFMDRSIENICYISSMAQLPLVSCREDATCKAPNPDEADTFGDEEMEEWKDNGEDNKEGCNTAGGMVLCKDCNCCKHKHFCADPVDPVDPDEKPTEGSRNSTEWATEWSRNSTEWGTEWSRNSTEWGTEWSETSTEWGTIEDGTEWWESTTGSSDEWDTYWDILMNIMQLVSNLFSN